MIRISLSVGILFLFINCLGTRKSLKFDDVYSLDVRILETEEWLSLRKKELKDLDKIVQPKLKYYLNNDFKVYEKLDPHYEMISIYIDQADSLIIAISKLLERMENNPSDSLDMVPDDTTDSYRDMVENQMRQISRAQSKYFKSIKKLKKGFKFDKKKLVFVLEESEPLKEKLYQIKYRREAIAPGIGILNSKLNEALFVNSNSSYSKRIIKISKIIDNYNTTLDRYENYLLNIDRIARKEAGGYVILIPEKSDPMEYVTVYEQGMEEYFDIIDKIEKIIRTIQ
tara:strand:- start:620 stop:1471 length:852 start_codon:yes stop_codon:yes gene_type:complete